MTASSYTVVTQLRHNGDRYRAGDTVQLEKDEADYLLSLREPPIADPSSDDGKKAAKEAKDTAAEAAKQAGPQNPNTQQ